MNSSPDVRETLSVCDKIESLAIESTPESTGVTTFVQEACTAVSAVDPSYSMTYYPVQDKLQDVRDYFARPVCLIAGTVGATRGTFYDGIYSITQLLGQWSNGVSRLLGAYGIRYKSVFTLQVAATPFHQGLIALSHQYGCQTAGSAYAYRRSRDPSTVTNLPHTVLDLSNDTSIQLHVPFLYVSEYADVRGDSPEPKYGCVSLSNLVNVPTVSGMGAPTYQLYLHLEDIELFGATPQATTTVTLTAGRKLSPVTEEFEKDSHPFSSALYASSRAVSFIAKGVPSISSIGGPVAWALGKAAGVVRYFGYGKPSITDPVMRNFRQDNVMEYNTDVASAVNVLAITSTNTTSINTMVGASDVDEMSLAYINSRWGQINVFELATSSPAGTLIYATPICPLAFWFRAPSVVPAANIVVRQLSTATSNSIQPSHIMFSASSFKQWRGGLKFRFTFAKTKMHAGRVMVAFNPYLLPRNNTESLTTATGVRVPVYGNIGPDPFGYSAVFDLKDGNVFEFKVPFVCPVPYAALATITGALAMYVVNPLVASSVVSSTISVVVEVAGDSDFELANPAGVMFPVHNSGTISLTSGRVLSEAPEVMNQLTMGEVVTSVKQLIAVPVVQFVTQPGPNTDVTFYVPPWFYQPAISALVPASSTPLATGSFSYGGNWASCYAYLKGGTDVHVYDVASQYSIALSQLPDSGGFSPNTATPDNRSSSNAPVIFTSRGALHARLPGFFPTARVFSWAANKIAGLGVNWLTTNPFTSSTNVTPLETPQAVYVCKCDNVLPGASALTGGVYVNRNAADDAQLSMYIGPPPIYLPPSSVAGPYDVDSVFIQGA